MPEEKKSNSDNDKLMGLLAYLGVLVIVPIIAGGNSKFIKYHANQGLALLLLEVALFVIYMVVAVAVPALGMLLWVPPAVLTFMGILNVFNNEMKPLPVIGDITLLK